jgi:hypothetical protein
MTIRNAQSRAPYRNQPSYLAKTLYSNCQIHIHTPLSFCKSLQNHQIVSEVPIKCHKKNIFSWNYSHTGTISEAAKITFSNWKYLTLMGLHWGFFDITGLEIVFRNLYSNRCKSWPIIFVHNFRSFARVIILVVKNDPKLKRITTLFTQIGLRIAQKTSNLWLSIFVNNHIYLSVLKCFPWSM